MLTSRRRFLRGSISGLAMLGLGGRLSAAADQSGPARRCLVLWMNGGPSQLETFDPKPGTSTGGPTRAISTSVPGVAIAEHLPRIAERMDKHAVIRNLSSSEGEHQRAQYYLHTGFQMVPAFPRPAIGSVISHEFPEADWPKYVMLGGRGFGPAYCGPDHASFTIDNAESAHQLLKSVGRRKDDFEFLAELGREFDEANDTMAVKRRRSMIGRIERIVMTPFGQALDLDTESESTRSRYGDNPFGSRCLLARRLLEREVPFVEVQLDGWDTHVDNFNQVARLSASLDQGWAALVDDLDASGLWNETLVVWMGEFGRTPVINGQRGRDHFPAVTPVVFGGGMIQGGQVIGKTNRGGTAIEGTTVSVADLSATVLSLLGIDPLHELQTSFGSPTTATDNGTVIESLLG